MNEIVSINDFYIKDKDFFNSIYWKKEFHDYKLKKYESKPEIGNTTINEVNEKDKLQFTLEDIPEDFNMYPSDFVISNNITRKL
jgi:hypothetical protein